MLNGKDCNKKISVVFKALCFLCIWFIFGVMFILSHEKVKLSRNYFYIINIIFLVVLFLSYNVFKGNINVVNAFDFSPAGFIGCTFFSDSITFIELVFLNMYSANLMIVFAITFFLQTFIILLLSHFNKKIISLVYKKQNAIAIIDDISKADEFLSKFESSGFMKFFSITFKVLSLEEFDELSSDYDVIFLYTSSYEKKSEFVSYCYQNEKTLYFNIDVCDSIGFVKQLIMISDIPFTNISFNDLSLTQKFFKRLFDIVCSLIGIVVSFPVMVVCAIAIKLDDGGKILFTQKRYTKKGKVYNIYKFRTMTESNVNYELFTIHNRNVTSVENYNRITKTGKVLRKLRLDELPQLFNIFLGDMSIVGPRPEIIDIAEKYTDDIPEFSYRLKVKAGLTGLAQVLGKYNTTPLDKLLMDIIYIQNYSFWDDLKIIFLTLHTVTLKSKESTEFFSAIK